MRLTCPNCGAQYEVPDDVIPQAGRDVQCSNCGDTWFQAHPDHPAAQEGHSDGPDDWEEAAHGPEPEPAAKPVATDAAERAPDAIEDTPPSPPEAEAGASGGPDPAERPVRREIDPAVASVLREEAEREKRARAAAQGAGLEMQTDLGLQDTQGPDRRSAEARARMARLRGDDGGMTDPQIQAAREGHARQTDPQRINPRHIGPQDEYPQDDAPQSIDPTSRRSLFPDIEEINSSLAPGGDARRADPDDDAYREAPARGNGGFRRGFLSAFLIAVAALLIYVFAPQLSDTLPALRGVLADYVVWVDGLRQWLDGQIAALMLWLDGMASTAPAPVGGDTAPD